MIKKLGRKIKARIRRWLGIYTPETGEQRIERLRSLGAKIGERVVIFHPASTSIDETRPWLLDIGNDVQIPYGVSILTHGYDWSVLKGVYGDVLGSSGRVKIGNNVFIGAKSIILKGVTIGDNVIIGAGSVVAKDIPGNCVAAGNPCRVIMSIDEYYEKRKALQIKEATELVREYRRAFGKDPTLAELSEFFFLFSNSEESLDENCKKQMHNLGNYEYTLTRLNGNNPPYDSLKDFLNSIE